MSNENILLDAMAKENQSLEELLGMNDEKTEDITLLKKMAEEGNQNMITYLGLKYLTGDGVSQDVMEAMYWLEKSDSAVAMKQVGDFYRQNNEDALAEEWYLKAVKDGKLACSTYMTLAIANMDRKNGKFNAQKADKYLKAAFAASPDETELATLNDVSDLFAEILSKEDSESGVYWMEKALERKENEIYRALVENIYAKHLVGENESEESKRVAAEYFEKRGELASDNGVIAMFYYYNDASMDAQKRIIWTKRAADAGWANAQLILSMAYLGKEYNKKIILEQDLDACEHYANLLENNPKAVQKDHEVVIKIRNTVKAERDKAKALTEKYLTQEVANELMAELRKSGSNVLRIPEGYTHIDNWAFFDYLARTPRMKNIKELVEVIFPDSVRFIDGEAFKEVKNLREISLPKNLEYLGLAAFNGNSFGLFGMEVKDKRTVEKLIIPKNCELAIRDYTEHAFSGIYAIRELIFEEGRKSINCTVFYNVRIEHLYIPDSVTEYKNPQIVGCKIASISAPAHLKPLVSQMKVKNITYR